VTLEDIKKEIASLSAEDFAALRKHVCDEESTGFTYRKIHSWDEFFELIQSLKGVWVYRGQRKDWPLKTTLERALVGWGITLKKAATIERELIREFRRRYHGEYQTETGCTLSCLALMQHHGAPTRLLDGTYSPFVAAQFALGTGNRNGVIWCIKETCLQSRVDRSRSNETFESNYMSASNRSLSARKTRFG
jgi:hypothetical protein